MAITTVSQHVVSVNAIQGTLIADNAITAVHIATNAVSGTLIADNAVTATHIAQNTITVTQIADDAIEAAKLADGIITTNHLNKAMISSQTEVTPVGGDFVLIGDTSDSNNLKKAPLTLLLNSNVDITSKANLSGASFTGDLTITTAGPSLYLVDSDNNPDYQIKNGNGHFRVIDTTNSADRFNIGTTGNVGIGYAGGTAAHPLQISGGLGDAYHLSFDRGNSTPGGDDPWLALYNNADISQATYGWGWYDSSSDGSLQLWNRNNSTTGYDVLTALRGGNVGVGTTSPDNVFHVQESALSSRSASNSNTSLTLEHATDTGIQFFSATQTQLRFGDAASTAAGSIIYTHSDNILRFSSASAHRFTIGGTEAVRINSSGEVGIGTDSPAEILHTSTSANNVGRFTSTDATAYIQINDSDDSLYITTAGQKGSFGGNASVHADNLNVDFTNGNVGIGTTSPSVALHVEDSGSIASIITRSGSGTNSFENTAIIDCKTGNDAADGFGPALYFTFTDSGVTRSEIANISVIRDGADNSGQMQFGVRNAGTWDYDAMVIDSTSKVGIGDASPMDYLEINGSGSGLGGLTISNSTHNHAALSFARSAAATARIYITEPDATHTSAMHLQTSNASGGSPNLITAMTIDEDQNVGIGTGSPAGHLHVHAGSGDGYVYITGDGNPLKGGRIVGHDGGLTFQPNTGSNSTYAEAMRITTNKDVCIGTGTALANAKLTVDGGDMMVQGANNSCGISDLLPGYTRGDYGVIYSTANHIYFKVGSSYISYINGGDGTFNVSDSRIKENIATLTGTLDKVKQLRGVSFTWKDTEERGTDTKIGLIAQEVEAVYPQLVDDGALPKDNEGNDPLKSVNYAHLTSVLIEAVKELDTKLTAAEARIKTLEDA